MVSIERPNTADASDSDSTADQFEDVAHVVVLKRQAGARARGLDHTYRIPLSRFPDDYDHGDDIDDEDLNRARVVYDPGDEIPIEVARELNFAFYRSDPDHFALFDENQNRLDGSGGNTSEAARKFLHQE